MFIDVKQPFYIEKIYKSIYDRRLPRKYDYLKGEIHDFWEIVYVISGNIEIIENDEIYLLSSGDMLFHAPMVFHRARVTTDSAPHLLNLSFVARGNLPEGLNSKIFHLNPNQMETYLALFDFFKNDVLNASKDNAYIGQEAALKLSAFIIDLCNNAETTEPVVKTSSALIYKKLIQLMNKEVLSGKSLDDFAKESFISVSYIKLLFKEYAGISPKTYYNQLRVEKAKKLLLKGMSVLEVSAKMNFSSPNYFIRFFKNHTSVTPHAFKKSKTNKADNTH